MLVVIKIALLKCEDIFARVLLILSKILWVYIVNVAFFLIQHKYMEQGQVEQVRNELLQKDLDIVSVPH